MCIRVWIEREGDSDIGHSMRMQDMMDPFSFHMPSIDILRNSISLSTTRKSMLTGSPSIDMLKNAISPARTHITSHRIST